MVPIVTSPRFTGLFVGGEHVGVTALELQGDSFAHHSDAVDGVDKRFGVRLQQVTAAVAEHLHLLFVQ
jgi:hypothetical protein